MIYASATSLSASLNSSEMAERWLYPDIARIRNVSVTVAVGVIRAAQEAGVDREVRIRDLDDAELEAWIREKMYDPHRETENVEREVRSLVSEVGAKGGPNGPVENRFHL